MKNIILVFNLFLSAQYAFADTDRVTFRRVSSDGNHAQINESIKVCCQNEESRPVGPGFTCTRQGAVTRQCLQQIAGGWQSYMQQEERVLVNHLVRYCGNTYDTDRVRAACVVQNKAKIANNNSELPEGLATARIRWRHMQSANFILGNLDLACELASGNTLNGNQVTRPRRQDCQYQRVEHVTINRLERCFHRDSENTQARDFNNPIEARRMWACTVGVGGTTRQIRQFSDEQRSTDQSEVDDSAPTNTTDIPVERNFENIWNQLGDAGTASQFGQCATQANQSIPTDTFREMNCRRVERDENLSNFANHVVGMMEMGDASQYLDLLRLEAVSLTLKAIRRNFGNPRIQVPNGCRRIQQGFDNIMSQPLSTEDQNHLNNVRSAEYAEAAQAAARRILNRFKPEIDRLPIIRYRIQRAMANAQARGQRIPEHLRTALDRVGQRYRDIREQILADFNRYPVLAVNHDYSQNAWTDLPSVELMARSSSPRDTLRGLTMHLLNGYRNQIGRLCNTRAISWQDLIRDESLNNTVLSRYPEFSAIRQCLSNMVQREDETRETILMAGMLGCGAAAALVGAAATPFGLTGAGFAMGLACASLQVAGSYHEYETQQRRFSLTSSCKMIMGEDEQMCSTEDYLRAREEFEASIDRLQTDLALGVALDIALPGLMELAPLLRTTQLRTVQNELRAIFEEAQEVGSLTPELQTRLRSVSDQAERFGFFGIGSDPGDYKFRDHLIEDPFFDSGISRSPAEGQSMNALMDENAAVRFRRYTSENFLNNNESVRHTLDYNGIQYSIERDVPTLYENVMDTPHVEGEVPAIFRITGRGNRALSDSPLANALTHPRLQSLIDDMNDIGVGIYVDSSLPLQRGRGGTSVGAEYRRGSRSIIIGPDTTWSTLLHEAQHAIFDEQIYHHWHSIQELSQLPDDVIARRARIYNRAGRRARTHLRLMEDSPLYRETFEMAQEGHLPLGIDETIATRVQDDALREAGYTPLNRQRIHAKIYGLENQIEALESSLRSGTGTAAQRNIRRRTLRRARLQRQLFMGLLVGRVLGPQTALATGSALGLRYLVEENSEEIRAFFNEERGIFVFQNEDGDSNFIPWEDLARSFTRR